MDAKYISEQYMRDFFRLDESEADARLLGDLMRKLKCIEYANNQEIITAGDKPDGMYFIDIGRVEVYNPDGELVNELGEGQYFGEYAVLADERRLTTVRTHGHVVVYKLDNETVINMVSAKPAAYGYILKSLYGQLSLKHSQILSLAKRSRGVMQAPQNRKNMSLARFIITYALVAILFVFTAIYIPEPSELGAPYALIPLGFLIVFIFITKRTLESLILSVLLFMVMIWRGDFLASFFSLLTDTVSNADSVQIILIMGLLGAMTSLLEAAGGVGAFKRIAQRRIKSRKSVLLTTIGVMAATFVDDYLSLITAAFCTMPLSDDKRVPREVPAFIVGSGASSVCMLIPLSIWGVLVSSLIGASSGTSGFALFVRSIPLNFASILGIIMIFLLAMGKLPLFGALKAAERRVARHGELWPEGSERYFSSSDDKAMLGSIWNLLVPLVVLICASILIGTLREGSFSADIGSGLLATLLFMFVFYCAQRIMTPEGFVNHMVTGIKDMTLPVVLYILTLCFSSSLEALNFTEYLGNLIPQIMGGATWMLPLLLFVVMMLVALLLGSSWAMFVIGIPLALNMASATAISAPLCIGAVCAAGIVGDNLCPYPSEGFLIATVTGCEPMTNIRAKLPYWLLICVICALAYCALGLIAAIL